MRVRRAILLEQKLRFVMDRTVQNDDICRIIMRSVPKHSNAYRSMPIFNCLLSALLKSMPRQNGVKSDGLNVFFLKMLLRLVTPEHDESALESVDEPSRPSNWTGIVGKIIVCALDNHVTQTMCSDHETCHISLYVYTCRYIYIHTAVTKPTL